MTFWGEILGCLALGAALIFGYIVWLILNGWKEE